MVGVCVRRAAEELIKSTMCVWKILAESYGQLGFCSVCAFFSFFMRVILSFSMLESENYALLYAHFGRIFTTLCAFVASLLWRSLAASFMERPFPHENKTTACRFGDFTVAWKKGSPVVSVC